MFARFTLVWFLNFLLLHVWECDVVTVPIQLLYRKCVWFV